MLKVRYAPTLGGRSIGGVDGGIYVRRNPKSHKLRKQKVETLHKALLRHGLLDPMATSYAHQEQKVLERRSLGKIFKEIDSANRRPLTEYQKFVQKEMSGFKGSKQDVRDKMRSVASKWKAQK